MAVKTLYLIRHAEPDFPDGEKLCLGRKNDLPLGDAGRRQAALLGDAFSGLPLEAVYTSPLLRARQTAERIACVRPLHVLGDLIELDGGAWDGVPFRTLRAQYPQHFDRSAPLSCPPGGETDESGLARARAALAHIEKHTKRCAAIVAHSGINRILLCSLMGLPMTDKRKLKHGFAATSIIGYEDGVWTVQETGVAPEDIAAHLRKNRG